MVVEAYSLNPQVALSMFGSSIHEWRRHKGRGVLLSTVILVFIDGLEKG